MKLACMDITSYHWLDHESVGYSFLPDQSLLLFRDSIIRPSLKTLDQEITTLQASNDVGASFLADDLAAIFQTTVEGYTLTIQSILERSIRGMLIKREKKLCKGDAVLEIEKSTWGGKRQSLQSHFERLMGIPINSFDTFDDLNFLQNLANALKHGDGDSAREVYKTAPSLWPFWLKPGYSFTAGNFSVTVPDDAPNHPPLSSISLSEEVLEQMVMSAIWFWEDIDNIRCNSFVHTTPDVEQKIARWKEERRHRRSKRVWTPS